MIIFILILILLGLLFWSFGFMRSNDLSIPAKNFPSDIKRVLIIFPHADDEALAAGGSIAKLAPKGIDITWVLLTQGERGNEGAHLDENLKTVRKGEAEKVASILGINKLIQKDFPDNGVTEHKAALEKYIELLFINERPDLVITYDLAGMYGHPDHIVVSEVVTELISNKYPETKLWYASYPRKILDSVSLPEHMAKDENYGNRRSYPTHKVWVGYKGVIKKIKAVHAYKSQKMSFIKMMPNKQVPLWFYISLTPFEYYHEVEL